jgi:ABC-type iron transport system FetAB ATPase subunit
MSPNLINWEEPQNCPKCGSSWGLSFKPKDIKAIFCSNARCSFAWVAEKKTLFDAVVLWNKICDSHDKRDRPDTPLLVRIYSPVAGLFKKDLTKIVK